jgi:hypothetical protein
MTIGRETGLPEEQLQFVSHVTPSPDGGVVFFERQPGVIRHFDSAGRFVRNIGRRGDGPGEFGSPAGEGESRPAGSGGRVNGISYLPDARMAVWNDWRGIHVFDADGKYITTWALPRGSPRRSHGEGAADASGRLFTVVDVDNPFFPDSLGSDGMRHRTPALVQTTADGTVVDTLVRLPITRGRMIEHTLKVTFGTTSRSRTVFQSIPFEPYGYSVSARDGHWVYAQTDRYAFVIARRKPAPVIRVESDLPPVPVDPEEREFHRASLERSVRSVDGTREVRLEEIPAQKPYIVGLRADYDSRIWVQLSQPGMKTIADSSARWTEETVFDVFRGDGEFFGRVRIPWNATFAASSGTTLWLVHRDSLDVQTLVRYLMTRAP